MNNTTVVTLLHALCTGIESPLCLKLNASDTGVNSSIKLFDKMPIPNTDWTEDLTWKLIKRTLSKQLYPAIRKDLLPGDSISGAFFSVAERLKWNKLVKNTSLMGNQRDVLAFKLQIAILTQTRLARGELSRFQDHYNFLLVVTSGPAILLLIIVCIVLTIKCMQKRKSKKTIRRQHSARRLLGDLQLARIEQIRQRTDSGV